MVRLHGCRLAATEDLSQKSAHLEDSSEEDENETEEERGTADHETKKTESGSRRDDTCLSVCLCLVFLSVSVSCCSLCLSV